jgi:hypothetical protein
MPHRENRTSQILPTMIFSKPDLTDSFVLLVDQHKVLLVVQFWYSVDETLNITYTIDSTIASVYFA